MIWICYSDERARLMVLTDMQSGEMIGHYTLNIGSVVNWRYSTSHGFYVNGVWVRINKKEIIDLSFS